MKIQIKNKEECKVLSSILKEYEFKRRISNNDDDHDETVVINTIKGAIEGFMTQESFDYIGPMACTICKEEWIAIFPKSEKELECPKCRSMIKIPTEKKQ